jgi:hypothetical protein
MHFDASPLFAAGSEHRKGTTNRDIAHVLQFGSCNLLLLQKTKICPNSLYVGGSRLHKASLEQPAGQVLVKLLLCP